MASSCSNITKIRKTGTKQRGKKMSTKDKETQDDTYINPAEDDWGFVGGMDESVVVDDRLLPDNTAPSALNCGFVGVGGGGGLGVRGVGGGVGGASHVGHRQA